MHASVGYVAGTPLLHRRDVISGHILGCDGTRDKRNVLINRIEKSEGTKGEIRGHPYARRSVQRVA
jgi:hypothetical protein